MPSPPIGRLSTSSVAATETVGEAAVAVAVVVVLSTRRRVLIVPRAAQASRCWINNLLAANGIPRDPRTASPKALALLAPEQGQFMAAGYGQHAQVELR